VSGSHDPSFIALDVGTTHTRAWLAAGETVLAERRASVGVRDTARDRSNARLQAALAEVIQAVEREGGGRVGGPIIASGMIGSTLGLGDVPHVDAPAGVADLARAMQRVPPKTLHDRPIWIVPGVRTRDPSGPALADVMRGEETLCLGALATGSLRPGDRLVSIGSHWKRITTDSDGRITGSRSSLGGELVQVVKSATVIAEAVPEVWPARLAPDAIARGQDVSRRVGLPRALFELRLDQLAGSTSQEYRLGMLVGAVIGADLTDWPATSHVGRWAVAGAALLADAWAAALEARGHDVVLIGRPEAERAQRVGLREIAKRAGLLS
jgi:2-dehydro-3-deoxygalactonokinase